MKTLPKALVGTVAAAAVAVSSATPAVARDHRGGIDGGDIIAGALVIGGIAAIAAAASNNNDRRDYDRYGYGDDWRGRDGWNDRRYGDGYYGRGNPRQAIEQCVRTAERNASRYSYGRADVTDIRDVRNTRWGYEVRGRIAVNTRGRDWRDGDRYYGRGWGGDYRGWDNSLRGYDSGSFKCKVERGRVVDIDYSGIRGL
ncbi:hypothetical protein [Novosphingobium taihuense]|uniref:Uncharacterized protein n=1 Tax=Novosphingobium taihuense TaxID=260085 RepID=A0A7W7A8H6_9SPHN|nr:hypothetical protein [Novosphingobium taihuense]MBB4612384.1 hypothetical protein [Novosphingobium taihuense]TWH88264.1 hypothetical protein IQ25_00379 [Novosphingobium taihuense]